MTFRTTLQDLDVAVFCDEKGKIINVCMLDGACLSPNTWGDLFGLLKRADPKHIKDLEEEASQHLQEDIHHKEKL